MSLVRKGKPGLRFVEKHGKTNNIAVGTEAVASPGFVYLPFNHLFLSKSTPESLPEARGPSSCWRKLLNLGRCCCPILPGK
jgi:hypothetical protein